MEVAKILLAIIGLVFPLALVAIIIVRLRQRRLFVHFRLIDEKTQQPLAGAEVFRIAAHKSSAYVMHHSAESAFTGGASAMVHGGQQGAEQLTKVGTLDQTGAFRGVFSAGSGGFTVRGPGISAGLSTKLGFAGPRRKRRRRAACPEACRGYGRCGARSAVRGSAATPSCSPSKTSTSRDR